MYNDMQVPLSPTMPIMNATQGCKYFMAGGTEKGGAGHGTRTFYTDGKKLCWTAKKTAGKGSVKSPTIKEVSKMRILSPEDWFTICDASSDGIIQEGELKWLYSKAREEVLEGKALKSAMDAMDTSGDGKIDKKEFLEWWKKEGGGPLATFTKSQKQTVVTVTTDSRGISGKLRGERKVHFKCPGVAAANSIIASLTKAGVTNLDDEDKNKIEKSAKTEGGIAQQKAKLAQAAAEKKKKDDAAAESNKAMAEQAKIDAVKIADTAKEIGAQNEEKAAKAAKAATVKEEATAAKGGAGLPAGLLWKIIGLVPVVMGGLAAGIVTGAALDSAA